MLRRCLQSGWVLLLLLPAWGHSQDEGPLKSGPPVGQLIGGSFHPYNVNGKIGKERHHCLVCEFALNPVALVFVRERADGKDEHVMELLKRIDKAIDDDQDGILRSFVVFLTPHASSSLNNPAEQDINKLVEENIQREALLVRCRERAEQLKNIRVTLYPPEGPKNYHIAANAEITVLLYLKHRVQSSFAYRDGKMTKEDTDLILRGVDELLGKGKKPAPKPQNAQAAGQMAVGF